MGIQVTVKLTDINNAGLETRIHHFRRLHHLCEGEDCYCHGDGCYVDDAVLEVNVPPIGWVRSYSEFDLCFDNKFANDNIREAIEELKIPYVRG